MVKCMNCGERFYDRRGQYGKKLCVNCRLANPVLKEIRHQIKKLGRSLTFAEVKELKKSEV